MLIGLGASVILSLPLGFWHFLSLFGHSMAWAVSRKVLAHTLHTYAQLLGSPVIGWRFWVSGSGGWFGGHGGWWLDTHFPFPLMMMMMTVRIPHWSWLAHCLGTLSLSFSYTLSSMEWNGPLIHHVEDCLAVR